MGAPSLCLALGFLLHHHLEHLLLVVVGEADEVETIRDVGGQLERAVAIEASIRTDNTGCSDDANADVIVVQSSDIYADRATLTEA